MKVQANRVGRVQRHPKHTFHLFTRPYQIQPFLIAPVLAGETMKNLLLQARVVTDPVQNRLIGWWQEYYFFYVKARDTMSGADEDRIRQLFVDPAADVGSLLSGSSAVMYTRAGSISWTARCLVSVVEHFFRDEGQAYNLVEIGGLPAAQISGNSWMDSLQLKTAVLEDDPSLTVGADDKITGSEVDKLMEQWTYLRDMNMTDMSYEDYLRSYGVKVAEEVTGAPELIRYVREFQYPSNHINTSSGTATSAVSWSIQERADKDRFFREPGFIFGVTVTRPKIYSATQKSALVHELMGAYDWLPAVLSGDANSSLKDLPAGHGLFGGLTTENMTFDIRDLFVYGDQFLNFEIPDVVPNTVSSNLAHLPWAGGETRYVSEQELVNLFVTSDRAKIEHDGIVSLSVLGMQRDNYRRGTELGTASL